MSKIKNKKSKLFNGISIDKIQKVMDEHINYCSSRIQSMEDNFSGLLTDSILKETNLSEGNGASLGSNTGARAALRAPKSHDVAARWAPEG